MKTVIVAGAHSDSGKTTILRRIASILGDVVTVKLGRADEAKEGKEEILFPSDATIDDVIGAIPGKPAYLLIEGNSILKRFDPDLAIFVDGDGPDRRSDADELKGRCDMVVGGKVDCRTAFGLGAGLGLDLKTFGELLNAAGVKIANCQLGCF